MHSVDSSPHRNDRLSLAFLCIALLAIYAYTAPRSVALEDDALFIGSLHFFGVAHPPGYPFYTVVGGILYHLLFFLESPAYKAHLVSGFTAVGACAVLFVILRRFLNIPALTAALVAFSYGVSKTFWSQAIVAEVYDLNAFLFFAATALILLAIKHQHLSLWIPVVVGFGLANHHPLFILAALGWLVFIPSLYRLNKTRFCYVFPFVALLVAGLFYGWLIWRSHANPVYNFSGIFLSAYHLWYSLTRGVYANPLLVADAGNYLAYTLLFFKYSFSEYTAIGFVFACIGSCAMVLKKASPHRRFGVSLWLAFLGSSIVVILLIKFTNSLHQYNVFRVYPVVAYGVMALWIGMGVVFVGNTIKQPLAAPALAALVAVATIISHWDYNNRRNDHWAEEFAQLSLDIVKPNGVLFTRGDWDLPLGYVHFVRGARPDITLHTVSGLVYNTRIFPLRSSERNTNLSEFLRAEDIAKRKIVDNYLHSRPHTPFYYTFGASALFEPYPTSYHGFVHRFYLREPTEANSINPATLRFLEKLNAADLKDPWTIGWRQAVNLYMAKLLSTLDETALTSDWRAYLDAVLARTPSTRIEIMLAEIDREQLDDARAKETLDWLNTYTPPAVPTFGIFETTEYYYLRALLVQRFYGVAHPDYEESLTSGWEAAIDLQNKNLIPLLDFYAEHDACRYNEMLNELPDTEVALHLWTSKLPAAITENTILCD